MAVDWATVEGPLLEAAGGQILAEAILDQVLAERVKRKGAKITHDKVEAERVILARLMARDPDEAQRLIRELRLRNGFGDLRFNQLLYRTAALRLLIAEEVKVTDESVRQAFELEYGERYEVRLIVTESLPDASKLLRRARAGESFIDLAIAHSKDVSSAQGGMIDPVSPVDPTYPTAIRRIVTRLQPGQICEPIMLESQFALVKLERKIPSKGVTFAAVRDDITWRVRRRAEDLLMRELRRTIIEEADIVIVDKTLKDSWLRWKQQRQPK